MNKKILALAGGVVALVIVGGAYWYLSDDAPDEVSLDAATAGLVDGADPQDGEGTEAGGEAAPVTIPGTWTVDTESGDFDFESATGSFVGFRVDEELGSGIGAVTAVGRTGGVTGTIEIDEGGSLVAGQFTADLTTLTTDRARRDSAVQRALGTATNPTATFVVSDAVALGDGPLEELAAAGVAVDVPGDLTIAGVTQSVVIPIEARLVNSTIVVVGSIEFALADYGVSAPTAPIVVSVSDTAVLEVQLLFVHE